MSQGYVIKIDGERDVIKNLLNPYSKLTDFKKGFYQLFCPLINDNKCYDNSITVITY